MKKLLVVTLGLIAAAVGPEKYDRRRSEYTVLLQADVTANDEEDQALLQRFGVFGPPTIIFFGADGRQREGYEVVGYMKAARFVEHIRISITSSSTITAQTTRTH